MTNVEKYEKWLEMAEDDLDTTLTSFYIIGRYDVYKQKISKDLDNKSSKELLNKSKEAFAWLKSLQT